MNIENVASSPTRDCNVSMFAWHSLVLHANDKKDDIFYVGTFIERLHQTPKSRMCPFIAIQNHSSRTQCLFPPSTFVTCPVSLLLPPAFPPATLYSILAGSFPALPAICLLVQPPQQSLVSARITKEVDPKKTFHETLVERRTCCSHFHPLKRRPVLGRPWSFD